MERISSPLHAMAERYDAIVVGSGYGGGIAASRLARAGADVCVLERGLELHPGEYPDSALTAPRHIQVTTAMGRVGSPTAMIDFHVASDIGVVRGCGLGGTSLINASVALRADPRVFEDERWPREYREGGAELLEPYYERAEAMLGTTLPPAEVVGLPKTRGLVRSGAAIGAPMEPAPLNVTFEARTNAAGVPQDACTLCGDCVSGCNHNAKNTVLMNYLPDAYKHGAEIFCGVEVRSITPRGDGTWLVTYRDIATQRHFRSPDRFVVADTVVLGAGALGSTEILLRSRQAGLSTSERLGRSFTGNGDVVAFVFDADDELRAVGTGTSSGPEVGPCITGTVSTTHPAIGDVLIQEGAVPGSTGWVAGLVWAVSALLFGDDADRSKGVRRLARRLWQLVRSVFGPRIGPPSRSMTYLVMSQDDDDGEIVLEDDRLRIRWPDVASRPVFRAINDRLRAAAHGIGGTFVPSPMWASPIGSTLLTVQPLGGCDMGDDATHGVTDHKGRVFSSTTGTAVHAGLYVADGALIPRPLGANPSLTISAVAERIVELLIADRGYAGPPKLPRRRSREPGVRFAERLSGHVSTRVQRGYRAGERQGRADGSSLELVLTVDFEGLSVLADPTVAGMVRGTAFAPGLLPGPLVVEGTLRLFVPDPRFVETWHMRYRLTLRAADGRCVRIDAFKLLRERGSLDAWPDTSTAYVRVADTDGGALGVGIVRITVRDFIRLAMSIDATNVRGWRRWSIRARFVRMFVRTLLSMYGGALDTRGEFPPPSAPELPEGRRPLRARLVARTWSDASGAWHDGPAVGTDARVQLWRYGSADGAPARKGPVILSCGFGMSATSYVLDTTDTNLVEYLVNRGYDVWLFDHRGAFTMPGRAEPHSLDDIATEDWPAAVAHVIDETGADVQVVAHCVGALTLQMALLRGMTGVRSAVCSALTVFFVPNPLKRFLNSLGLEGLIARIGIAGFTPPTRPTLINRVVDVLLRLHPIPREERCGQAICRWVVGIYGPSWRHAQLNEPTHDALWSAFGFGNFSAGRQFGGMFKAGRVLDRHGKDTYLDHPERLALPLLFLHGARSHMFHPDGSARTLRWLQERNPSTPYGRIVLDGYGHVDTFIGRDAHVDVFPAVAEHLDRYAPA